MPFFSTYLDYLASIPRAEANGRLWLHTVAPTNINPANGRTNVGGGAYEAGMPMDEADWTDVANGDFSNAAAIDFGVADEAVGTVTHWSFIGANRNIGWGTLPNTVIAIGGSLSIDANALQLNGSST